MEVHDLARLEAVLFVYGEPIEQTKLAKLLSVNDAKLASLVEAYAADLAANARGLMLIATPQTVQLVTKPELHEIVGTLVKEELTQELTPAALETLALVAYFGPISRARIEYIRGVNSAFTLRNLLIRGMIERVQEGRGSYTYRITPETLRYLGLRDVDELPDHPELSKLLEHLESQQQATGGNA